MAFIAGAGAFAGVLGSAGGITSLISYPALLLVGIPPLQANVTNAVALVGGGLGGTVGSRPELRAQGERLKSWLVLAAVGGTAGALLLLATPPRVFAWIVPFLLGLAALLLIVQPRVSAWRVARDRAGHPAGVLLGIALVSVYSGYFGAGAGVMMIALLLVLAEERLATANAFKNVLLVVADALPAVIFAVAGPVVWRAAVPLALGSLAGGATGPAITRRAPSGPLRIAMALCAIALAVVLLGEAAW
jgi:uncharacterized membrane protein YfcA